VFDPAVVTVGKIRAGTTNNVIPESATILGTIRTVSPKTRERVQEMLQRLAEGIADAHGGSAAVTFDRGYPVTVNHDDWATTALAVAGAVLGDDLAVRMPAPVMGAEDFSYVLEEVPGAMVFLGTDPKLGGPAAPNHSNRMLVDESAMASGIAVYAGMALHHLQDAPPL
jgi:amidohydrolase